MSVNIEAVYGTGQRTRIELRHIEEIGQQE